MDTIRSVQDDDVQQKRIFRFGIIADVQYADRDPDVEEKSIYYRDAIPTLRKAIDSFSCEPDVKKVVHLGDIVDGNLTLEKTIQDFDRVLDAFSEFGNRDIQVHHVLGNHCYRVPRDILLKKLGLESTPYYSTSLHEGWRLIVLDTTDLSFCAWPEGSAEYEEAERFFANHPSSDYPQMLSWNGGLRSAQLDWLRQELAQAEASNESCIVCSHHPLVAGSARPTHLSWNGNVVADILVSSPSFVAAFHGHDHQGGYATYGGKHFTTLEAIVECPPGSDAFGIVDVHSDRLFVHGTGTVTSRTLKFV